MASPEYPRRLPPPRSSFFLFGVRGVGKGTWARKQFPDAPRIDLLDEARYQEYLANPSLLAAELASLPRGAWAVIDEVQRVPALLNEVHRLIEDRRLRFALLGSSARKLKTAGTNQLAGRALNRRMLPLTPAELGADFRLDRALEWGTLPLIWTAQDPRAALAAYAQLYLREEIRAEALVRNLPGFVRFLPIAALFHGQVISVSGLACDAGVARTTVHGYLEILEDTLMTFRLPGFEPRLRVRERKHPKLYWVDPGIVRAVKKQLGPLTREELGPLFEGWILHQLRAEAEVSRLFDEIYCWAPSQGGSVEVDFLLRRGREYLALEVKSAGRFQPGMTSGLRAIGSLPRLVRRLIVYTGARALSLSDGMEVWPHDTFAEALATGKLWP